MTNSWPWIVTATVCCLLALDTSCLAEAPPPGEGTPPAMPAQGRWLLWWSEKTVHSSYQTKADCEEEIREIKETRARGHFVAIRMSCLPDTVDPRGPKGK